MKNKTKILLIILTLYSITLCAGLKGEELPSDNPQKFLNYFKEDVDRIIESEYASYWDLHRLYTLMKPADKIMGLRTRITTTVKGVCRREKGFKWSNAYIADIIPGRFICWEIVLAGGYDDDGNVIKTVYGSYSGFIPNTDSISDFNILEGPFPATKYSVTFEGYDSEGKYVSMGRIYWSENLAQLGMKKEMDPYVYIYKNVDFGWKIDIDKAEYEKRLIDAQAKQQKLVMETLRSPSKQGFSSAGTNILSTINDLTPEEKELRTMLIGLKEKIKGRTIAHEEEWLNGIKKFKNVLSLLDLNRFAKFIYIDTADAIQLTDYARDFPEIDVFKLEIALLIDNGIRSDYINEIERDLERRSEIALSKMDNSRIEDYIRTYKEIKDTARNMRYEMVNILVTYDLANKIDYLKTKVSELLTAIYDWENKEIRYLDKDEEEAYAETPYSYDIMYIHKDDETGKKTWWPYNLKNFKEDLTTDSRWFWVMNDIQRKKKNTPQLGVITEITLKKLKEAYPEYIRKQNLYTKIILLMDTYEMIENIASHYEKVYIEAKKLRAT